MTQVLALDLGAKTGWALMRAGTLTGSGTNEIKRTRFEGGGMRYIKFRAWLDEMNKAAGGLVGVYFEEVRGHKGVDAAHAYGGYLATLTAWCEQQGIPYDGIPVGTIKKHATGKGNTGKDGMMEAASTRWGIRVEDDNEADALCLLDYVRVELLKQAKPAVPMRKRVVIKVKR